MDLRESSGMPHRRHPWETARAAFFARIVLDHLGSRRPVDVLDFGSGDAYLARHLLGQLPRNSSITCVDSGYDDSWLGSETLARGTCLRFVREIPPTQYDWVLALDVLEHVPNDRALLRDEVAPAIRSEGRLLVSVPAWQSLYTAHDVRLGHVRRYSVCELKQALDEAEVAPVLMGGLFSSLLLPRSLCKLGELVARRRASSSSAPAEAHGWASVGTWSWPPLPTRFVSAVLRLDAALGVAAARRSLFIPGLSIWVLAQRRWNVPNR
ncbi:MAG: hypothetical protein JW940_06560 [Polyangiaceae bacterium]|nr:hypothetical protein [Polyangiaceae bacterium]